VLHVLLHSWRRILGTCIFKVHTYWLCRGSKRCFETSKRYFENLKHLTNFLNMLKMFLKLKTSFWEIKHLARLV
jgi:hypothetical protein